MLLDGLKVKNHEEEGRVAYIWMLKLLVYDTFPRKGGLKLINFVNVKLHSATVTSYFEKKPHAYGAYYLCHFGERSCSFCECPCPFIYSAAIFSVSRAHAHGA